MRTGHNAVADARVARVNKTYSLQAKATPPLPPTGMAPGGELTPPPTAEEVQAHEWAGDLYEQGDQSDPMEAFARFQGVDGETAWLDRADDGTLTGWVQDADGSVYRYSDDAAWAIDVDQAGMRRNDVPEGTYGDGEDPMGGEPAADPAQDAGGFPPTDGEPADDAPVDDAEPAAPVDDIDALTDAVDQEFADGGADLPEDGEPIVDQTPLVDDAGVEADAEPEDPEDPEDPEELEDEDGNVPPGLQTKSWPAPGGGRFRIRRRGGHQ